MKKRASRRYDYQRAGHCVIEGSASEVQLFNISTSGIQFGSKTRIPVESIVELKWNDDLFETLSPSLVIAREVPAPENAAFKYFYGAQYYNLNEDIKYHLLLLLKYLKRERDLRIQEQVNSSQDSLFSALVDGEPVFNSYLHGEPISSILKGILDQTKDYEKNAFSSTDLTSVCIQKLTICNFQCQILIYLLKTTLEKTDSHVTYLDLVSTQMDKTAVLESGIEDVIKEEADVEARKKLNESSNRLFYTKQKLLQSITTTFPASNSEYKSYDGLIRRIKNEYEKLLKVTEVVTVGAQKLGPFVKMPEDFSLVKNITDVRPGGQASKIGSLTFTLPILGLMLAFFAFRTAYHFISAYSLKNDLNIPIPISRYEKFGDQISIYVPANQWNDLPQAEQQQIMGKISNYLVEEKTESCTIYGNNDEILQVIYQDPLAK